MATPPAWSKPEEAPFAQIAGDAGQVREILLAHAAREHARLTKLRGDSSRALDHRHGGLDAFDLGHLRGDILPIVEGRLQRLHEGVAVDAEDFVHQFVMKTVHHRHHHDQRGDAERDPHKGKQRDNGNAAVQSARAQVTSRDHPFEGSEHSRVADGPRRGLAHLKLPCRVAARIIRAPP